MPGRLFLVHWDAAEADGLARRFRDQGWEVFSETEDGARACKTIGQVQPDLVVIGLSRRPSHGTETALALRKQRATRSTRIVLVGGDGLAIEKARARLPDVRFATVDEVIEHPGTDSDSFPSSANASVQGA